LAANTPILLVGLGNPGPKYHFTRHNAGFILIDLLVRQHGAQFKSSQFNGEIAKIRFLDQEMVAFKPGSFMNLSGGPVSQLMRYQKFPVESLIVLYDDIDVPLGKVKFREGGGHGGHNGIRSIIDNLGSDRFGRIKLGVGRPSPDYQGTVADYVLSAFSSSEQDLIAGDMYKEVMARLEAVLKQRRGGSGN
jgi:PTH1 family peptidyl-tRNA hydrolase